MLTTGGRDDQDGFTLLELLVVMVIIGILASVAIPVFLSQRGRAHDAAVKADISTLGKEVMTYFIGGTGPVALDFTSTPGSVIVSDGGSYTATVLLSKHTLPGAVPAVRLDHPMLWCVSLTDPAGKQQVFNFSGLSALGPGPCP